MRLTPPHTWSHCLGSKRRRPRQTQQSGKEEGGGMPTLKIKLLVITEALGRMPNLPEVTYRRADLHASAKRLYDAGDERTTVHLSG